MARRCAISGIGPMSGNRRSHSNSKSRRRFLPNLRTIKIDGQRVKISMKALRTMEKRAGK